MKSRPGRCLLAGVIVLRGRLIAFRSYDMEKVVFKSLSGETEVSASGGETAVIRPAAGVSCTLGRCSIGKFSESGALSEKWRVHFSSDNTQAEAESSGRLPFGCEYQIRRTLEVSGGFVSFVTDIAALNHGFIREFRAEPLVFSGLWREIHCQTAGGEIQKFMPGTSGILLKSGRPVILLRIKYDNCEAEFSINHDIWRHDFAFQSGNGVESAFTLTAEPEKVALDRLIFSFPENEELPPPKRPWRFTGFLAWSRRGGETVTADETVKLPDSCLLNPAVQRALRRKIRTASGNLTLSGAKCRFCSEPSHLGRRGGGNLHTDLEEAVSLWHWGNRRLAPDRKLAVLPETPGERVALDNLRFPPELLDAEESEQSIM